MLMSVHKIRHSSGGGLETRELALDIALQLGTAQAVCVSQEYQFRQRVQDAIMPKILSEIEMQAHFNVAGIRRLQGLPARRPGRAIDQTTDGRNAPLVGEFKGCLVDPGVQAVIIDTYADRAS